MKEVLIDHDLPPTAEHISGFMSLSDAEIQEILAMGDYTDEDLAKLGIHPADYDQILAAYPEDAPVDNDGLAHPTGKEIVSCAALFGVSPLQIAIIEEESMLTSRSFAAIKITGNKKHVVLDLDLVMDGSNVLAGLCVFVAGNQGKFTANVNVNVSRFVYIGRGNKTSGEININSGISIDHSMVNLSGNKASLDILGEGSFPCENVRTSGNKTSFTCNQ